jgi:hypothetical protein
MAKSASPMPPKAKIIGCASLLMWWRRDSCGDRAKDSQIRGGPIVLRTAAVDYARQAAGLSHRRDEVVGSSGGPAGNARLTAWTGLLLLVLFGAELVTLLDVRGWIDWHIVLGVLLIPPALVKTASTSWRIVRYYTGSRPYRDAGPPTLVLRLLGPLVVLFTLAVLGSGVALILVSPDAGRRAFVSAAGFGVSLLMIHKATFVVWGIVTGAHTLGRLIPALQLTVLRWSDRPRVPGRHRRSATLAAAVVSGALAAVLALSVAGGWRTASADRAHFHDGHAHGGR